MPSAQLAGVLMACLERASPQREGLVPATGRAAHAEAWNTGRGLPLECVAEEALGGAKHDKQLAFTT